MSRLFTLCLGLAATLAAPSVRAQSVVWTYTGGPDTNASVLVDADGFLFLNASDESLVPFQHVTARFVQKLSPDGQSLWTHNLAPLDPVTTTFLDAQGNVIVFRSTSGPASLTVEQILSATGSSGWSNALVEPSAFSVVVGALLPGSNGTTTALARYTFPGTPTQYRTAVLRFDGAGNLSWSTFAAAPNQAMQQSSNPVFEVDAPGNAYYSESFGFMDMRLVRVDPQGAIAWTVPVGSYDNACGLTIDPAGNAHFYVQNAQLGAPVDALVLNTSGALVGSQTLPMTDARGHQAAGRLALAGTSTTSQDVLLQVRDDAGSVVWSTVFPALPGEHSHGSTPQLDSAGGLSVRVFWSSTHDEKARYDRSGHLKWDTSGDSGTYACGPDASMVTKVPSGTSSPFQVYKLDLVESGFCFGDGAGTACPCGNTSSIVQSQGCTNSLGTGARLTGTGQARITSDHLVLGAQGATGSALLLAQGDVLAAQGAGVVFGDGLRCIGGSLLRIATRPLAAGALQYPHAGDPLVSVRGGVTSPGTRAYQGFYRNNAAFCTPSTQNTTNGVVVHWLP